MKQVVVLLILIAVMLAGAFSASQFVWGKGHVPAHKDQVCHVGEVITVGTPAVRSHIAHGDCFIDKNSTGFFTGDPCSCNGDG